MGKKNYDLNTLEVGKFIKDLSKRYNKLKPDDIVEEPKEEVIKKKELIEVEVPKIRKPRKGVLITPAN